MKEIILVVILISLIKILDVSKFNFTLKNTIKIFIFSVFYYFVIQVINIISIYELYMYIVITFIVLAILYNVNIVTMIFIKEKNIIFINCDDIKLNINELKKFCRSNNIKFGKITVVNKIDSIGNLDKYNIVIITSASYKNYYKDILTIINKSDLYLRINDEIVSFMNKKIVKINDIPFVKINQLHLSIINRFFKRMFDIIFSIIALIIFLPLSIIISVLIKIDSKGKIIYSQYRETINNKKFKIYKFRSMFNNSEINNVPLLATPNDSRITRVGKIIRKLRIDEIPQFINVLRGDMSIVGPRPERSYFIDKYSQKIKYYNLRHLVKAGITGLSHVYGNYYTLPEYRYVYDLIYISNYSMLLDIRIVIKTVFVVLYLE